MINSETFQIIVSSSINLLFLKSVLSTTKLEKSKATAHKFEKHCCCSA